MIRSNAFQSTDRDGLGLNTSTPTCGFARPIAHAAKDARKDIGLAIDEIRLGELPERDESDVFRNVGVCGASPLAVDDAMEIVRISSIGWFHRYLAPYRIGQRVFAVSQLHNE